MTIFTPLPTTSEINFAYTQGVMRNFIDHINKVDDHDDEEMAALSSMPLFTSIVNQLQVWNGDVQSLPEAELLIDSINEYTHSLEDIMEKTHEH
jgi:hypothetical protein